MQIKQLDHINMTVDNLEESKSWYQRVFGFEVVESGSQGGHPWCIIRSGDAMLAMYESPGRSFDDRFELAKAKLHGVSHFAFRIQDLESWTRTIASEKLEIHYGGAVEWPNSTSWYVSDPTGYEIEVALWKNDEIGFSAA